MAAESGNGHYTNERLDRIEIMLNTIAADHILFQQRNQELQERDQELQERDQELQERHQELQERHQEFLQEHQLLLRAQVVMQDTMQKLAENQSATDERLNALIATVDGIIRNPR